MKRVRIIIAGGGTGGHLFPAIAIADEIKKINPDAEIVFVGTNKKIEAGVVPKRGYPFRPMWISGWSRTLRWDSILFPVKVVVSILQSCYLIKKIRPDVVVGTGGYVSGPVVFAAWLLGIPTVIQEQNSYPGVTTKLLAKRATEVHITFDETRKYLAGKGNVYLSGTPTRGELGTITREQALRTFGFDADRPVVLVFGGSLGAAAINEAVIGSMAILDKYHVQLIWATGDLMFETIRSLVGARESSVIVPFIEDMPAAYAAASLAICRAGATTIAELTRTGTPAILIPYPLAAANHQEMNARTLVDHDAARLILNNEVMLRLPIELESLLSSPDTLCEMGRKAKSLGRPEAGSTIAQAVLNLAQH